MDEDIRILANGWKVTIAKTLEQVENLRHIWQEMQNSEHYPVPNADIDWYLSVLRSQKEQVQPYVMLFHQHGEPAAMVIARLEQHKLESKIGYKVVFNSSLRCLTIVYGGFLGDRNEDCCNLVMKTLFAILMENKVDMVWFNSLATDSVLFRVARKLPGFLCREHGPVTHKHWVISLPDNIDQFYQTCSKKHRNKLKRSITRLEEEYQNQIKLVIYSQENDLDEAVAAISRVDSTTYQHGMSKGFISSPLTSIILKLAARHNWLRIYVLYIGDEPCSFRISLHYKKKYFGFGTGYDPKWKQYRVGTVLFLKALDALCNDPAIDTLDFGFGDAEYKSSYGNKQWDEASVYVFAPRLYPVLINVVDSLIRYFSLSLAFIVRKLGFTDKIKRRWRNKLQQKNKKSVAER